MKKFLEGLWKFVNSKIFGYIMILVFAILFLGTCSSNTKLKDESDRKDQNISAMSDTITEVRLKNNELQVKTGAFMATEKELKDLNSDLAKRVSEQKGKVVTLNRIVFNLTQERDELQRWKDDHPPVVAPPSQVNDSTWNVPWSAKYVYDSTGVDTSNYDIYAGITQIGLRGPYDLGKVSVKLNSSDLTYRDSKMSMVWGQKWEGVGKNKKLVVYAQTSHPAFEAKLLKGTYVDYPKRDHWFTGFGIGPQIDIGYDFMNNRPAFVVGVGIHYNIYNF